MSRKPKNLLGRRFGRLLVESRYVGETRHRAAHWNCTCDWGGVAVHRSDVLLSGGAQSCGCLASEVRAETAREVGYQNKTHGQASRGRGESALYITWAGMKARCLNPSSTNYPRYGGRGIAVCERWMTFENFAADMGTRPPGHSLDRINPNGNYEPGNCRWATPTEQNRNRRDNRILSYHGEMLTLSELCERAGMPSRTVSTRISKLGWSVEQALETPVRKHRRH